MRTGHGALAHQAKELPRSVQNVGASRGQVAEKAGFFGKVIAMFDMVGEGGQKVSTSKARRDMERARRAAIKQKMVEDREKIARAVKDALLTAEILSGSYNFKVLSHRIEGGKFSVLVDIRAPLPGGVLQQKNAETLISRLSHTRWGLNIVSVYWRVTEFMPKKHVKEAGRNGARADDGLLRPTDFGDLPGLA